MKATTLRKVHCVAVIVVTDPKVFNWLGHMPVVNWCLEQLNDVRGIDQVVCVADPKLLDRAGQVLAKELGVTVAALPRGLAAKGPEAIDRWLTADGPAAGTSVVVIFRPVSPFLPAGKIEACVEAVRRNRADVAFTGREVRALVDNARTLAFAQAPALQVLAPTRGYTVPRVKTVPVALTEALDFTQPEEARLSLALVGTNAVAG